MPYRFLERSADGTERDITDELPFEVPETWEWVRLGSVVNEISTGPFGSMLHKSDYVAGGIPLVNPQNIIDSVIYENSKTSVSELTAERLKSYSLNAYDVVIARRGEMGRCAVVEQNQAGWLCGTGCFILRANTNVYIQYITTLIRSRYAIDFLTGNSIGTTMSNLNHGILNKFLVPLPPLAEQQRIVARIEELLPHISTYEIAEQKLTTLNAAFPEQLKKSILQAAVQGKLVPQDPNDEPASILLERIRTEREQLIKDGKIKRSKNESIIFRRDNSHYEKIGDVERCIDDELPFEIPESWAWVRIKSISELVSKGTTPRGGDAVYKDSGIGFLRVENIGKNGELSLSTLRYIDKATHLLFRRSILQENDFLISIAGALGRTAIVPKDALPLNTNQAVSFIRWFSTEMVYVKFIKVAVDCPEIQKMLLAQTKVTAIPNLTLEIISDCLIPFPPLAEQHRIVERIERLMTLTQKLKPS